MEENKMYVVEYLHLAVVDDDEDETIRKIKYNKEKRIISDINYLGGKEYIDCAILNERYSGCPCDVGFDSLLIFGQEEIHIFPAWLQTKLGDKINYTASEFIFLNIKLL
jgi:hypothetical protein